MYKIRLNYWPCTKNVRTIDRIEGVRDRDPSVLERCWRARTTIIKSLLPNSAPRHPRRYIIASPDQDPAKNARELVTDSIDDAVMSCWNITGTVALAAALASSSLGCKPGYDQGWTPGPALPEPIQEIHAAVLHGRIYIAGGINAAPAISTTVYRLDPASGRWEQAANLPDGRHHMPLAVIGDSLYAIGGLGPNGMTAAGTLWLYDERTDRWQSRAPLPEPRGASAVGVIDGRIFVVGGFGTGERLLDSIAIYQPATDRWRHGAPIPTPRDHLGAVVIAGRLYATGGRPLDPGRNFKALEVYDPATDTWNRRTPMPTARGGLAAVALDNRMYTYGGETTRKVFAEQELYDVTTGAWSVAPRLPSPRHGLAAAILGNRIYVIGGGRRAGLGPTDVVEIYAP
jgi:N-acetylneuraminic acid mutarotase